MNIPVNDPTSPSSLVLSVSFFSKICLQLSSRSYKLLIYLTVYYTIDSIYSSSNDIKNFLFLHFIDRVNSSDSFDNDTSDFICLNSITFVQELVS